MSKTTSRCPGCGCTLSLCPRGGRVRHEPAAFCSHLVMSKGCAGEMYDLGHCINVEGKAIVADSIHPVRLECGKVVVRGCDHRGTQTWMEDCESLTEAGKIAEEYRNLPRLNPSVSSWRGK